MSDSPELLKPSEVTERDEKIESLKQELAENTRYYTARLNEAGATIGIFKDKLEAVQAKKQRLQNDLGNSQAQVAELRAQLEAEKKTGEEREEEFWGLHEQWDSSKKELRELQSELSDLKQKSAAARELSEAAYLLNQLKSKRKKSTTTLADIEAILEMIEE